MARKFEKILSLVLVIALLQTSADLITSANLSLYLAKDASGTRQIDVHKVTGSWSSSSITWNNQPAYNAKVEDYEIVTGSLYSGFSWDVTGIVKEWYSSGVNNGLMLKTHDEAAGYTELLSSDCDSTVV